MKTAPKNDTFVSRLPIWKQFIQLDKWLRIHYPLIWRTKVHYFVLFSFLLINPILYLAAHLYPISFDNFLSYTQLSILTLFMQFTSSLILIFWGCKQRKMPSGELSLKNYFKLWGIYSICIFSLYINSIIFLPTIISKTANLIEYTESELDYNYHANNNFWCCDSTLTQEHFKTQKHKIEKDLQKYKILKEGDSIIFIPAYKEDFIDRFIKIFTPERNKIKIFCDFNSPCINLYTAKELRLKLSSIRSAKRFMNADVSAYSQYFDIKKYLSFSLVLGFLMLLFTSTPPIFLKQKLQSISYSRFFLLNNRFNFFKNLDKYILKYYPFIWITKTHNYIASAFLICIILFMYSYFEKNQDNISISLMVGFVFIIALGIKWAYQQTKNGFRNISKFIFITYFFLLNLPFSSYVMFSIFVTGLYKNELGILYINDFLSICLILYIYISRIISVNGIGFAIFIGLVFVGIVVGFLLGMRYFFVQDIFQIILITTLVFYILLYIIIFVSYLTRSHFLNRVFFVLYTIIALKLFLYVIVFSVFTSTRVFVYLFVFISFLPPIGMLVNLKYIPKES